MDGDVRKEVNSQEWCVMVKIKYGKNRMNEWRGWQGKGMKERNIPVAHGPGAAPRVSDPANSSSPVTSSIPIDGKVRPKVRPKQAMD